MHPQFMPWTDFWFVGPDREAWQLVNQSRPWVIDDFGNHCDLVVLHAGVCCLDRGLSLGLLQVLNLTPGYRPFDVAFDRLMHL